MNQDRLDVIEDIILELVDETDKSERSENWGKKDWAKYVNDHDKTRNLIQSEKDFIVRMLYHVAFNPKYEFRERKK